MTSTAHIGIHNPSDLIQKWFMTICYAISIICALAAVAILVVNVYGQLNLLIDKIKHPVKRPRAVLVMSANFTLLVWDSLLLILINSKETLEGRPNLHFVLLLTILICSMVFYSCCFAYFMVLFFILKFHRNLHRIKIWWLYVIAYLNPAVMSIIVVLTGYGETKQLSIHLLSTKPVEWVVISVHVLVIIASVTTCIYVVIRRVKLWVKLKRPIKEIVRQLFLSKIMRNGVVLAILLTSILMLDIYFVVKSTPSNVAVYHVIILHTLLGIFFLSFDVLFFDKDYRKPFQRRQVSLQLNTTGTKAFVFTEHDHDSNYDSKFYIDPQTFL